MFIPLFIAILLGLVSPSTTNTPSAGPGTTVNVSSTGDENPDEEDPGNENPGDDTGGEGSQIPPRKP